jgi:hypothetical protein
VSANPLSKSLIIDEVKGCGAWHMKVATIGLGGVETGFYLNGSKIANIITRFDLKGYDSNWLNLNPSKSRIINFSEGKYSTNKWAFGEHNSDNIPHGKVILFEPTYGSLKTSNIEIENFHYGFRTSGNYINIPVR